MTTQKKDLKTDAYLNKNTKKIEIFTQKKDEITENKEKTTQKLKISNIRLNVILCVFMSFVNKV
jgi:hypothetical protein